MSIAFARPIDWDKKNVSVTTTLVSTSSSDTPAPPLGDPANERRFWWQRRKGQGYDPENIATLPSVFDDPDTADKYQPPENWYVPTTVSMMMLIIFCDNISFANAKPNP